MTGCDSQCALEGNFFSCEVVGAPCAPNCGFSDGEMINYYLEDPTCAIHRDITQKKLCGRASGSNPQKNATATE